MRVPRGHAHPELRAQYRGTGMEVKWRGWGWGCKWSAPNWSQPQSPGSPWPVSVPGRDSDGVGHVVTQGRQGTKAPLLCPTRVGGGVDGPRLSSPRPSSSGLLPFLPAAGPVLPPGCDSGPRPSQSSGPTARVQPCSGPALPGPGLAHKGMAQMSLRPD